MAINNVRLLLLVAAFTVLDQIVQAKAAAPASRSSNSPRDLGNVASKSVLAALLESPHTEMMELVEQAGMLQSLETAAEQHNLTIFAPRDQFLELHFDSQFRKFLLQPGNVKLLQQVVMFHVVPFRITASQWRDRSLKSLSKDVVHLHWNSKKNLAVENAVIDFPDMIVRSDGVVHRIRGLLIPKSVENAYAEARMKSIPSAVLPQPSPVLSEESLLDSKVAAESKPFSEAFPTSEAGDGGEIGSAPAPSPSSDAFPLDGHDRVSDFISALVDYGGYSEIAQLLVNLTSLASDIGRLVNEGHRLTVLVPNDHAINLLTTEQLNAPGGVESILTYHIIPEYQTEESLYSLAKRHDKLNFDTLRVPPVKLAAQEIDGVVQFGSGKSSGLLLDSNIYTDERISVQGINTVLMPPPSSTQASSPQASSSQASAPKHSSTGPQQQVAGSHHRRKLLWQSNAEVTIGRKGLSRAF